MPATISVQEAVRFAKDALGNVPSQELADWIITNLGITVNPVIVTVMLGSLLEKEHVERIRLTALELAEKARTEQPEIKPKARRKTKATAEPAALALDPQSPVETSRKPTGGQGCPACSSADYVFRGRKKVAPKPGEEEAVMETKHSCRSCGHQWKVRTLSLRGTP